MTVAAKPGPGRATWFIMCAAESGPERPVSRAVLPSVEDADGEG